MRKRSSDDLCAFMPTSEESLLTQLSKAQRNAVRFQTVEVCLRESRGFLSPVLQQILLWPIQQYRQQHIPAVWRRLGSSKEFSPGSDRLKLDHVCHANRSWIL